MGFRNYFSCFCKSKHRKSRKVNYTTLLNNRRAEAVKDSNSTEQDSEKLSRVVTEPNKKKLKEFLNSKSTKRVTFDLDVMTCKELSTDVTGSPLVKSNVGEEKELLGSAEADQHLTESAAQKELSFGEIGKDLVESRVGARDFFGSNGDRGLESAEVSQVFHEGNREKDVKEDEEILKESELLHRNNRYENFSEDDEPEDMGYHDAEAAQGEVESSESLFSLSIESRNKVSAVETGEKEVNSAMPKQALSFQEECMLGVDCIARDRREYVHSVLNPIENLAQWKAVKARSTSPPFRHQDKENINVKQDGSMTMSLEPSMPQKSRFRDEGNAVDTSLSSWLVGPEASPMCKDSANSVRNSPMSPEDRPILGALTVGDLKYSASISPKRTRSKSPDVTPIGTVGSYWLHTGQTLDLDSSSS